MNKTKQQLKAQAFVHEYAKNGSTQGLNWLISTGRLTIEQENEINKILGTITGNRFLLDALDVYYLKPNPKYNTEKLKKVARELAIQTGERYALYQGADLNQNGEKAETISA